MSVQGEFRRIVADAVACLRACDDEGADQLATTLESERSEATQDLLGAAERTLERWTSESGPIRVNDRELRARLEDAGDRLTQICRVVLGR